MASTNKTQYYDLSQFTAPDKLSVMSDYNNDMRKIDAGLYDAQTTANVADGKADLAQTTASGAQTSADDAGTNASRALGNIGTMANLETVEKTNLVGAINEILGLFNLSNITTYNNPNDFIVPSGTSLNANATNITVAKNSTGSICKIYGEVRLNTPSAMAEPKVTLDVDTGLRPAQDITISPCGFSMSRDGANNEPSSSIFLNTSYLTIKTTGKLEFGLTTQLSGGQNAMAKSIYIPFIIFVKNFGDTPTPE